MERRTIKIGAPENRIIYAIYAFFLTPRDYDLLYPVLGPVLRPNKTILIKQTQLAKLLLKKSAFSA